MKSLCVDEITIGDKDGQHVHITSNDLSMMDKNQTLRFQATLDLHGTPTVHLCDGNGNARICLSVEDNGVPYITLRDGNFTQRLELKLGEDEGEPELSLDDKGGCRIFVLAQDYKGEVTLKVPGEGQCFVPWVPPLKDVA